MASTSCWVPTSVRNVWVQLVLLGLVMFSSIGIWSALMSLGLGGDPEKARIVNLVSYFTTVVVGFTGPCVVLFLGPTVALIFGASGYPLITLVLNSAWDAPDWALVVVGIYNGASLPSLYSAYGQLVLGYARENEYGKMLSITIVIQYMGAVIGTMASFAINYLDMATGPSEKGAMLSQTTYWSFFGIQCFGLVLAGNVVPIDSVTREGKIMISKLPDEHIPEDGNMALMTVVAREVRTVFKAFSSSTILFFAPAFFSVAYYLTYRMALIGAVFNSRTQSLVGTCYWVARIIGILMFKLFADSKSVERGVRIRWSFAPIFGLLVINWTLTGFVQYLYNFSYDPAFAAHEDFEMPQENTVFAIVATVVAGLSEGLVYTWSYWIVGMLSTCSSTRTRYAAFNCIMQMFGGGTAFSLSAFVGSAIVDYWCNVGLLFACLAPTIVAVRRASKLADKEDPIPSVSPITI